MDGETDEERRKRETRKGKPSPIQIEAIDQLRKELMQPVKIHRIRRPEKDARATRK